MDATKAILTTLYNALLNDTELAAVIGPHYQGPYHRTPVDAEFPFLTHKLDTLSGADSATRPASYTLEAWDLGETTDRLWNIRERLLALLDLARFTAPTQGIVRLWHASETWMPNEDRNVMTLALTFTVRYARAGEVRAIQDQKGS